MNKYLFLFVLTAIPIFLLAQDNWLIHIPTVHQTIINPAYNLEKKIEIGLPSYGINLNTGGINFKDATSTTAEGNTAISLNNIGTVIKQNHPLSLGQSINTFDIGVKVKSFNIFLSHSLKNQNSLLLDKDLVDLYLNGNAPYIGKTVELNINGSSLTYHQLGLGASRKIGKFSIGAKVNYLNGWYHAQSKDSKVLLTTGEDGYDISIENQINLQSSNVILYNKSIKDIDVNTDFFSYRELITKNSGLGIDLGVGMEVNKKLNVFASALNLGSITWNSNALTLSNQKKSSFKGVNIDDIIDGGKTVNLEDSIYNAFELVSEEAAYSTPLNAQFNIGATYLFSDLTLSAVLSSSSYIDQNHYNFSLQASKKFKYATVGLNYGIKPNNAANIGLLTAFHIGPVYAFAITDNVISTLLNQKSLNGLSARGGISLMFGKQKDINTSFITNFD